MDSNNQEQGHRWEAEALEELQSTEEEYRQEKLKQDIINAISHFTHEQRQVIRREIEDISGPGGEAEAGGASNG